MSTPAVAPDGTIYVASGEGIFGLDSTGALKCSIPGPANLYAWPLVVASDRRIYEAKYEDLVRLVALDPVSGGQDWECVVNTGQPNWFMDLAPALGAEGTVYVPGCSSLVAVNPDGTIRWRFATGQFVYPPAIGNDGTVYAPTVAGCIAIDSSGTERWRTQAAGRMAIGRDGVIYSHCFGPGPLVALNPDGTERWQSTANLGLVDPVVIDDNGRLYVGNSRDSLFCLNPDGSVRWRSYCYPAAYGSCTIGADGTIYCVGNTPGAWGTNQVYYHVIAFSPEGKKLWEFSAEGEAERDPCLGPDNTLVFSLHNTGVCAFTAPGSGGNSPWPMYQHDRAHTGRADQ